MPRLSLRLVVAATAVTALGVAGSAVTAMPALAAGEGATDSVQFATTGKHDFVVPAGVYRLDLTARGAAGGSVCTDGSCVAGGSGTEVSGGIAVTPGDRLTLVVGGQGGTADAYSPAEGGYNGGGAAAYGKHNPSWYTWPALRVAGGGGKTDVLLNGETVLTAGGGGGAGSGGYTYPGVAVPGGTGGTDAAGGDGAPAHTATRHLAPGTGGVLGAGSGGFGAEGRGGGGGGGGGMSGGGAGVGGELGVVGLASFGAGGGGGATGTSWWSHAVDGASSHAEAGVPGDGRVTISLPSRADRIELASGWDSKVYAGAESGKLFVRVTDGGRPVRGTGVTFTIPAANLAAFPDGSRQVTVPADEEGYARVQVVGSDFAVGQPYRESRFAIVVDAGGARTTGWLTHVNQPRPQ